MGKAVAMHPAAALIGPVACSELLGIWGAPCAALLAALLQAVGTVVWREQRGQSSQPDLRAVITKEKHEETGDRPK
jgi:predicted PurR-regulated permease PerM